MQRRATPRAAVECEATLSRGRGGAVRCRTQDLGPGGMRVATERPLKPDEQLAFEVVLDDGARVAGTAHVVREHSYRCYALCFERLDATTEERLRALAPA
jgi:PilZ domain